MSFQCPYSSLLAVKPVRAMTSFTLLLSSSPVEVNLKEACAPRDICKRPRWKQPRVRNRWAFPTFLQPVQPLRSKYRVIGDRAEAETRKRKRPMSETLLCPSTLAMSSWYPVGRILKAVKHTSLVVSCVASSSPLGRACFLSIACPSGASLSSGVSLALS